MSEQRYRTTWAIILTVAGFGAAWLAAKALMSILTL
jgi:hypothetical protein